MELHSAPEYAMTGNERAATAAASVLALFFALAVFARARDLITGSRNGFFRRDLSHLHGAAYRRTALLLFFPCLLTWIWKGACEVVSQFAGALAWAAAEFWKDVRRNQPRRFLLALARMRRELRRPKFWVRIGAYIAAMWAFGVAMDRVVMFLSPLSALAPAVPWLLAMSGACIAFLLLRAIWLATSPPVERRPADGNQPRREMAPPRRPARKRPVATNAPEQEQRR
jgi:hypothetical protein